MKKIRVTQQQRDNLLDALNVMWPSVPPANVYTKLDRFVDKGYDGQLHCGSIACFGGWCAAWPGFKNQGTSLTSGGVPIYSNGFIRGWGTEVANRLFGHGVFSVRNDHPADEGFKGNDHKLVTHRLQWLLKNSEVVA